MNVLFDTLRAGIALPAVIVACQKRQSLGIGENWGPANTGRSPDPDQTASARLVNDRAGFDLFFLGLVLAAGYTLVSIVVL